MPTANHGSSSASGAKARPDAAATLKLILDRLDDMKAEETVTIDLRGQSSLTDYMVVTSGRANRHVGAIAEHVLKDLNAAGIKGLHVEGLPNCDWVLIDAGDVILHVFRPEVRSFYSLEKMWRPAVMPPAEVKPVDVKASAKKQTAKKAATAKSKTTKAGAAKAKTAASKPGSAKSGTAKSAAKSKKPASSRKSSTAGSRKSAR